MPVKDIRRHCRRQGQKRKRYQPKTTDSNHYNPIAPNLLPEIKAQITAPNRVWTRDITYVPTREGWLYLAVEMDLFSRQIVGWACSISLKTDFVNMACQRASNSHFGRFLCGRGGTRPFL